MVSSGRFGGAQKNRADPITMKKDRMELKKRGEGYSR